MKRNGPDEYDRPWLILCEGDGDRRFLQALLKSHAIETARMWLRSHEHRAEMREYRRVYESARLKQMG